MKLDKNTKLADLMYGHPCEDRFTCCLSGSFEPEKHTKAPAIQLCEMKCGCWIVADGNNRITLILRQNPEATLSDIPRDLVITFKFGQWDDETMDWWNPCPRPFRDAMVKQPKKPPIPKNAVYGMIERDDEGKFFASTHSKKNGGQQSVTGRTVNEVRSRLEGKLKTALKRENIFLVLTPLSPLEGHRCSV